MKLAIFLPNWVGDLVMATPTLRAVRRHFGPSARICGILRPHLSELLEGSDWLDEPDSCFDPQSRHGKRHGRLALIGRMRRQRFDLALLLTNSCTPRLLAWLGGAQAVCVGYARDGRSLVVDQGRSPAARDPDPDPEYQVPHRVPRRNFPARADGRKATWPWPTAAIGCPEESPRLELERHRGRKRAGGAGLGARTWDSEPMDGS